MGDDTGKMSERVMAVPRIFGDVENLVDEVKTLLKEIESDDPAGKKASMAAESVFHGLVDIAKIGKGVLEMLTQREVEIVDFWDDKYVEE